MSKSRADVSEERGETVALGNRLWWLVLGRLVAALLLLAASAAWRQNGFVTPGDGSLRTTFSAGVAGIILSLIYAVVLRYSPVPVRFQIAAQFLFDVLLVTWLVWATGDLYSPYAALYIVIISLASIFLGAREALLTSVGCALCYTLVTLSIALGWFSHGEGGASQVPLGRAVGTIGFNDIAFFVVGLLAAQLAARQKRSDVQLIEATHALDNLRALHERVIESIRSGLVTTDLEGRVYTFNLAAEEITGYRAADLRGKNVSIIFGDIGDRLEASLRASSEAQPNPRYEAECLTAEGLRLRLGYSISPLYTEGGMTPGHVISFQDLTEVRSLEETSRRQDKLAAVGRVAAGIAHEIRNPLAAMRGSIQVLRAGVTADSAESELMEIVLRESDRLNQIITDFLTYARPRAVSLVEADVREPLRETFALLRHSPEIRDGHAVVDDSPGEPVRAMIDPASIKQVFWNLARNALHAMPDGGTLRAELRPHDHDALRITFTDTGRGMSPDQVERLFEPFSSSTTGGTGLGLSIVYQIVRDHGGTINVRSRQGHGTTITVELPAAAGRGQRSEVGGQ